MCPAKHCLSYITQDAGLDVLIPDTAQVNQVVWGVRGATGKDIHI